MIQYGQTVMCEELGQNDVVEALVHSEGICLQYRGDEEFLKGLIGGAMGTDKH